MGGGLSSIALGGVSPKVCQAASISLPILPSSPCKPARGFVTSLPRPCCYATTPMTAATACPSLVGLFDTSSNLSPATGRDRGGHERAEVDQECCELASTCSSRRKALTNSNRSTASITEPSSTK